MEILILAMEGDAAIQRLLTAAFENTSFRLIQAATIAEGLQLLLKRNPELILLDMAFPDTDSMDFLEKVRGWSRVPIIAISTNSHDYVKVKTLDGGADDYVTKPFSISELIARMSVALRHAAAATGRMPQAIIECGDLRIDLAGHEVVRNGERVYLTPTEFKLLATLAKHAGKVVTQQMLLSEVCGPQYSEESQYLRVYMGYLRKKLEVNPSSPRILLTEPRVGYRLAC